jgi:hypothetical protein
MVIVAELAPAMKLTVPDGRTPPTKSAALAGFAPVAVTAQATLDAPLRSPARVTVWTKFVVPALPSASEMSGDRLIVGAKVPPTPLPWPLFVPNPNPIASIAITAPIERTVRLTASVEADNRAGGVSGRVDAVRAERVDDARKHADCRALSVLTD